MDKPDLALPATPLARRFSRRAALRGLGGGLGLAAVAIGAVGLGDRWALPAGGQGTGDAASAAEPQTREFVLTASEFDHEIMPGTVVRAWGYDGQLPGPELRVREGDLVRVTLRNELPAPTTIHWHGVDNTPAMDGPAGLNQAAVEPGDEFVYEFVAKPGGTRWYHSHADPALQVPLGLYGPLIIEPREPTQTYDREYTLMLQEWDLELTPAVAAGTAPRGPRDAQLRGGELGTDLFLINGRTHGAIPPVRLAEGERVLLRLINAGHLAHPIHTHGHSFKIVATDGNPVPAVAQLTKDTVLIGAAERYDLELVGVNPGVWMLHCHVEHHMANGMMTTIWYDGHQPTGPAAEFFAIQDGGSADGAGQDHAGHGTASNQAAKVANPAPTAAPGGPSDAGQGTAEVAMVDDRFEPTVLTVPAGTTVVWVNKGADWHSVAAYDGGFESAKLAPGERFTFRFDQPGDHKYICKHHGLQGMIGKVVVT